MKFDWRDWRVILGAGIVFLLVIGIYFGRRYQSSDARLKSPLPVVSVPATPLDSLATVIAPQPDSGSETVTSDKTVSFEATGRVEAAADEASSGQVIRGSLTQLLVKKRKSERELDRLNSWRNEFKQQRVRDGERLETELHAMDRKTQKEINRVGKILEAKFGPNPTLEEVQSVEEWHQLGKLMRENDPVRVVVEQERSYSLKMKEIDQRENKLFDERSAITARIGDLVSQLAGE